MLPIHLVIIWIVVWAPLVQLAESLADGPKKELLEALRFAEEDVIVEGRF